MANEAFSDFTAASALAAGDLLAITDISDTTDSANGTTKKATASLVDAYLSSYETLFIGAGAMIPRTTNGAATGTVELATNDIMLDVFDFDTATEEGIGFWAQFGPGWDASTIKAKFYWTAASGSGTVKWDIGARSYADSDALDQAIGTEQGATDTLLTANDMHISPATSAITITGATVEEPIYFQVTRDVATDTLAVDARLIGVALQWKKSTHISSAW